MVSKPSLRMTHSSMSLHCVNCFSQGKLLPCVILCVFSLPLADCHFAVWCAAILEDDVAYLSLQNALEGALPYFVAVDESTKSVVVAIRGTFSMEDTITDILYEPVNLEQWLPDYMKVRSSWSSCGVVV